MTAIQRKTAAYMSNMIPCLHYVIVPKGIPIVSDKLKIEFWIDTPLIALVNMPNIALSKPVPMVFAPTSTIIRYMLSFRVGSLPPFRFIRTETGYNGCHFPTYGLDAEFVCDSDKQDERLVVALGCLRDGYMLPLPPFSHQDFPGHFVIGIALSVRMKMDLRKLLMTKTFIPVLDTPPFKMNVGLNYYRFYFTVGMYLHYYNVRGLLPQGEALKPFIYEMKMVANSTGVSNILKRYTLNAYQIDLSLLGNHAESKTVMAYCAMDVEEVPSITKYVSKRLRDKRYDKYFIYTVPDHESLKRMICLAFPGEEKHLFDFA